MFYFDSISLKEQLTLDDMQNIVSRVRLMVEEGDENETTLKEYMLIDRIVSKPEVRIIEEILVF